MTDENLLDEDSSSDIFVPGDKSTQSSKPPKQRHVLVIEDSRAHRILIEQYLNEAAHVALQVTHAVRLEDGLKYLAQGDVDVVLLDLNLPDSRGLETLHHVRSRAPYVPTVVLSAVDDESIAIQAVREGAEDFLVKGEFDSNLLVRSIRYAIARHRSKVKLQQAAAERAQLTAIVQSSENAILSADQDGIFLTWNPGAEKIFGYTADEAVGKHVSLLWPPEYYDQAAAMIERIKGGETVSQLETVRQRKDGGTIDVSISAFPVCDKNGKLVSIGGIVADITERKRTQEELEKKKLELEMAKAIQQRLLPQAPPALPGFDVAGALYPAEFAAGDYYDFLPMRDGSMGFVIADVSGHGLGPAMLMATTRAHLQSYVETGNSVVEILSRLNRVLTDETNDDHFVTLLFAQLDCQTRSFVYASAGHPPGFVLDSSGEVKQELPSISVPLAIVPDEDFPLRGPVQLEPGDMVFLPTDGLHEAKSPDGDFLGKENVLEVIRVNRDRSAGEIVQALRHVVCEFCGPERPTDDLTAVVIKVEAPA